MNLRGTKLSSLVIALLISGAWAIERWGPGLIPDGWSIGASGRDCRLDRVLDGDSIKLVCQGRPVEVRLYCIDAPEKDQRPWGDQSRAHLREITPRTVELLEIEKDRFGRTVAEVYSTGPERRSLNLEQVSAGQAAVYHRFCEDPRYFRAEREARKAKRGIWQQRGDHQTPWRFRHRRS